MRKLLNGTDQVLIKWEGLPECENTWEHYVVVEKVFPEFNLEDKVKLVGESVDRPIRHVYRRMGKEGKETNGGGTTRRTNGCK